MKCSTCGNELNNWNAFCPNCGAKAPIPSSPEKQPVVKDIPGITGAITETDITLYKIVGLIGIIVGILLLIWHLLTSLQSIRYFGMLYTLSSALANLLVPVFLLICGALLFLSDRIEIKSIETMFYKILGCTGLGCGIFFILNLVLEFFRLAPFSGIAQSLLSVAVRLIWPVLLLLSGYASFFLSDKPGYGSAAVFIVGNYCVFSVTNTVLRPFLGQYYGIEATIAWNAIILLISLIMICLMAFALYAGGKTESDSRKVLVLTVALGLLIFIISLLAWRLFGRFLQIDYAGALNMFVSWGRLYCIAILPIAAYMAFNSLLLAGNIRSYMLAVIAHIVIAAVLIVFIVVVRAIGINIQALVLALVIIEFIRAGISGFLVSRNG